DDIFYDIGCGMGRILCLASRLPVRMCIGIEIVPELAAIAEGNARMLRGRRSEIQVRIANAAEADYSDGTIYCMFNPFGAATMEKVLSRIGETLQESPRPVRLGYFNPVHENAFKSSGFLELTGRVEALLSAKTASYWTNCKWTGQKIPNHKFQITNNS
ncbi:MAG: class I SAM-dependent methyltransferase, partial [Syntrophales bacterium]|nr:class I SAM-dependent methyltransferase [Syntrophales bacterium]